MLPRALRRSFSSRRSSGLAVGHAGHNRPSKSSLKRICRVETLEARAMLAAASIVATQDAFFNTSGQLFNTSILRTSADYSTYTGEEMYLQFDLTGYENVSPTSATVQIQSLSNSGFYDGMGLSVDQNMSVHKNLWRDPAVNFWNESSSVPPYGDFVEDTINLVEIVGTTDYQLAQFNVTNIARRALLMGDANLDGRIDIAGTNGDVESFYKAVRNWNAYLASQPRWQAADLLERMDGNGDGVVNAQDAVHMVQQGGGRGGGPLVYHSAGMFLSRLGVVPGDVDLDGVVTSNDAWIYQWNFDNGVTPTKRGDGDVNMDGALTAADLAIINATMNQTQGALKIPSLTFVVGAGNEGWVEYASSEYGSPTSWRPKLDLQMADIPVLNSNAGATKKIFMDFNGHDVSGTYWNTPSYFNGYQTFSTIHAPAYDLDGNPNTLSEVELANIQLYWQHLAEDFRPFNVDVTTVAPAASAFAQGSTAQRVLYTSWKDEGVGGSGLQWVNGDYWGVAEFNSWFATNDSPAWVFGNEAENLYYDYGDVQVNAPFPTEYFAVVGAHEVGHAFNLTHDGNSYASGVQYEYYVGHGGTGPTSWGPIMGGAEVRSLTQWSKGEYTGATTTQDDLAVLAAALGYRTDDHTNNLIPAQATTLAMSGNNFVPASGIISQSASGSGANDRDVFKFTIAPGTGNRTVTINVNPAAVAANLDVRIDLYNGVGAPIAGAFSNPANALNASLVWSLPAGTYMVAVDGVGKGNPAADGYSDYGSLGLFTISGFIAPPGSGLMMMGGPNSSLLGLQSTASTATPTAKSSTGTVARQGSTNTAAVDAALPRVSAGRTMVQEQSRRDASVYDAKGPRRDADVSSLRIATLDRAYAEFAAVPG
jgi:hypothetical protein